MSIELLPPLKGVKSLYEAVNNVGFAEQFLKLVEMHNQMPKQIKEDIETKLPKETLDALEWARDFMNNYEKRKKCSG